ncbi:MAG: multiubiquitin domain-containing protein [Burkholderiaceae bacterium]|nr:multiubiquitin domain-containing protein [Burkholderiaceae bacterium]
MTENTATSTEDLAVALREGRPVRDHGPYLVRIGDERLEFNKRRIADPTPTGDQILDAAGVLDRSGYQVLQLLATGETESLRPTETTDLRTAGVESFVVFRTDRLYRFTLDGRALDWGASRISGTALLTLARKDPGAFDVWLDRPGGRDRIIDLDEQVSLAGADVERFVTKAVEFTIFINTRPRTVAKRRLAYMEVVKLAYPDGPIGENYVYTVDYLRGPPRNPEGSLVEGDSVEIKNGMRFDVSFTDKS